MSTEEKLHELREQWKERAAVELFDSDLNECDSPIERLFLGQVMVAGAQRWRTWEIGTPSLGRNLYSCRGFVHQWMRGHWYAWLIQPTVWLDDEKSRLDFLLTVGKPDAVPEATVAIELDGHDFHERTKEQARRDKSRDRGVAKLGWAVARFTGSEVHASPATCVSEVLAIAAKRLAVAK